MVYLLFYVPWKELTTRGTICMLVNVGYMTFLAYFSRLYSESTVHLVNAIFEGGHFSTV